MDLNDLATPNAKGFFEPPAYMNTVNRKPEAFDYILSACVEKSNKEQTDPKSAENGIDTNYFVHHVRWRYFNDNINVADVKSILIRNSTHGTVRSYVSDSGYTYFRYYPKIDYVGADSAVFSSEFNGKRYRIDLRIVVLDYVPEGDDVVSSCKLPNPRLLKGKK